MSRSRKLVIRGDAVPGPFGTRRVLAHGFAGLGEGRSVAQAASDGDTVAVRALANISVRFLGVDAPETKVTLPDAPDRFIPTDDPAVAAFLDEPLAGFPPPRDGAEWMYREWLRTRLGTGRGGALGANHRRHALAAERGLEAMMTADAAAFAGGDSAALVLHLAYGNDVFDRYGRLLAFLNAAVEERARRPPTYNERLLAAGLLLPYFIWPNQQPFLGIAAADAAPAPAEFPAWLGSPQGLPLAKARGAVAAARAGGLGVFAPADPLLLDASELRLLTGHRWPERRVINLAAPGGVLLAASAYPSVERPEDRLYVPREYEALFAARGWRLA